MKEVNEQISHYKVQFNKKDPAVLLEEAEKRVVLVNNKPVFFYDGEQLVPTLKLLQEQEVLKKIVVDIGAIKFVINGADVMRPGIKEIEAGIKKNEFIVIIDEKNKKPLAVGIALFDTEELEQMNSGKAIKNIHYLGDEIWRIG